MTSNTEKILDGPIHQGLFKLALPAMISNVSIMLFELIDLFWVGRLGAEAVAALGAASFFIWAIKALAQCTAVGINSLVSRAAGAKNAKAVTFWASQGVLTTLFFSLFILGLSLLITSPLFSHLGLAASVARQTKWYTLIMIMGLPFIYESFSLDTIFRSVGNATIPMLVTVFALFLNAMLDPFFMFGWVGFPKMGMPGGAVASIIAHATSMVLFLVLLPKIHLHLKLSFKSFWSYSRQIIKIGLPIGLLESFFSAIYIGLSRIISHFGTYPLAAIAAGHRLEGLPYFIVLGFSLAVATFVGQNMGNASPARAEKAVNLALKYGIGFLGIISIIYILWGRTILGFFVSDQIVINEAYNYLFAVSIFEFALALEVITQGAFIGAGNTKPPFFISIVGTALRIPCAYFLAIHLGLGVKWVWWVISISTLIKGLIMLFWFKRGHWKTRSVTAIYE